MEIIAKYQNYAWGVPGSRSSVAQFAKSAVPGLVIEEEKPYAELWMGTHVNGPSLVKETGDSLFSYIQNNNSVLGSNIIDRFGNDLCFLFKVLSVNQALSIQAHPEKGHAELLHKERPEVYKDPNHKPEMTIALTRFEALCGFRTSAQIVHFLNEIKCLKTLFGEENASTFTQNPSEENLKKCFSTLMTSPKEVVASALSHTADYLSSLEEEKSKILMKDLFLTLLKQYPGDAGCFSIYILNFIVLEPGEAMFLGPNVIHAYLLGDCIECMACSDNVVRAGLTPKFQDVEVLVNMLEYKMAPAVEKKFKGSVINEYTTLFNPPVPDFAVQKIQTNTSRRVELSTESSASILIVIEGKGTSVSVHPANDAGISSPSGLFSGQVIFIKASQALSFDTEGEFLGFRALCV